MNCAGVPCRSCGRPDLQTFLSLGVTPLANSLLTQEELGRPEPAFPLDVAFCPACSLVQITETVPPETLFREYLYFSSFSDEMQARSGMLVPAFITGGVAYEEIIDFDTADARAPLLQWEAEDSV